MPDMPMEDPAAGAMPPGDPAITMEEPVEDGGFTVCIRQEADGQLSVGLEGGEMRPAADRKDALTQALEILKADGIAPPSGDEAAQAEFNDGFQSRGPA